MAALPYSAPRQFRGLAGYANFVRLRRYDLRFIRQADGQVRIAAGYELGQPGILFKFLCVYLRHEVR